MGANQWGKSGVRVSKVLRGDEEDRFLDLDVQVLLTGDVADAYLEGDNRGVLPTDTTKNTIYVLAQDHLTTDLETFALVLGEHFVSKEGIESAEVTLRGRQWDRHTSTGFVGGGPERRVAVVRQTARTEAEVEAGIEGLVVLKTSGSAFTGFPRDQYTVLPEEEDRILSTSITARWPYSPLPEDTTATWERIRSVIQEQFLSEWSASIQHQGWMMARAVLDAVSEIPSISFELPNQHHLPFDLTRFGLEDRAVVFQPVTEPYGDIRFTVER